MYRPWNLPPPRQTEPIPCLTFAPLAWLKLQYLCHRGDTEVGGFSVAAPDDPMYVEEFVTVRQQAGMASVRFLDEAVADFFDACADRGLRPDRFARVWCHTHPGESATPSSTDEETFTRVFGGCDWALMFILSRAGRTYARLRFSAGPGAELELPTAVDWAAWSETLAAGAAELAGLAATWEAEYAAHVERLVEPLARDLGTVPPAVDPDDVWWEEPIGWPAMDAFETFAQEGWLSELDERLFIP